mmetsp:Transcript_29624/g.62275  ORF Transcript_29624/g.62275 Transcript_29624/m.62275 type:complete len:181 (+) Transcript_29624:38-580(+)|eukprot:CAMPEP_0171376070 /NCGR_PEP_ID=MMETSP0879-20121228/18030_1 /TAXON_ID=67004 /ORGANISM="Thalassiosira weissflogii, Strain CCMP1336" /LENGTH=180 /DNA_ID=CAMNT_0011885829 /DNA_START=1 /DNA_END=543 /DNA_ORIENTATION=-
MTTSSTEDDLKSIERSARSSFGTSQVSKSKQSSMNSTKGHREASMGSVDTFDSTNYDKNDLVVGFAPKNGSIPAGTGAGAGSSKAKQRNSMTLNPVALGALTGFDDSDMDDSGDEKEPKSAEKDRNPNPKASGGPEHRPLVGGFAAAAYEAARMDYYKKKGVDVRGHPPPRPRTNFPRYP